MSIEVKAGDVVNFAEAKSGASGRGPWFMVPIFDEKHKERIQLWANDNNALDCQRWKTGKIKEIRNVKKSARQFQNRWYPTVDVAVTFIEGPATSAQQLDDGFMVAPPDDLDSLPFN